MMSRLKLIIAFLSIFGAQQVVAQTYCVPTQFGFNGCWTGTDINSVTIGTFSDLNTGCGNPRYQDRTSVGTIPLTVGSTVSFTITSTMANTMFFGIWIDANGDGDFSDPNEFVWNGLTGGLSSGSFVVPAGSGTRRLRILGMQKITPLVSTDQCAASFNGEMQDYNCLINSAGCPVASAMTAHTLKSTSANLAWTGTGTKYRIEYGATGFVQGAGTLDSTTTNSKTITGLTAVTTYDYYVKNICSATNQSGWNGPYTFTTRCAEVATFPFTENFDATPWVGVGGNGFFGDAISTCWTRFPLYNLNFAWAVKAAATSSTNTGPSADASGIGNFVQVSSNGSPFGTPINAYLDLPVLNLNALTNPVFKFKYHMFGVGIGTLYSEASTDGGQTWVILDSIVGQQQSSKTAGWLEQSVSLTGVKTALTYLRFRAKSNASNGDIAIDEVFIGEAPLCPAPSSPSMTTILGDGATVSWNSPNTKFHIEYGVQGFTQGTGIIDTITNATAYTITGLQSESFYDVYVRSDCNAAGNGNSSWLGPITFRTYTLPPFIETFSTGFLPDSRWAKREALIGNPTVFNTTNNSQWAHDGFLNNGTTGAARVSCFSAIRNDWFFTKSIDLGIGNSWELYFDIGLTANGTTGPSTLGTDDKLLVVISTDNGATWSATNTIMTINQATGLTNSGTTLAQSLAGYSGVVKFGFYFESTINSPNYFDLFIDNLGVRNPGSCPAPNALNASNVTASSLWLNWTSSGLIGSYTVEYGPAGFTQGTGTFITNIQADSTFVNGLQPVTPYDFYIRSVCDTTTLSAWVGPYSVLSGCPSIFTTPYYTNFDVNDIGSAVFGGKMNNCWVANPATTGYHWKTGIGGQVAANGQTGPAVDHTHQTVGIGKYVYADAVAGPEAMLIGGPFDLSNLTEPVLKFYYHMFGPGIGKLHVDVSKDESNWTTDIVVINGQKQSSPSAIWLEATSPLSQFVNDTIYIRLRAEYGVSYLGDIAVDDLSIVEGDACESPNALGVISTTTTTAQLTWASYEPSTTIEYGPKGFLQGTGFGTLVHNASPNMTVTGLTPNTSYDYFVRDTCMPALWVGPKTFKTECAGALSGVYTIGGPVGANNFATLDSAVTRLNDCGISGPVTFNLSGGTQQGHYTMGNINGASATNTIQFVGTLGLDSVMAPNIDYALHLDGCAYVSFSGITFVNSFGKTVVWISDNAHHINLTNCEFIGLSSTGSNTSALIAGSYLVNQVNTYGSNGHHITINQNRFIGSHYGINFNGPENALSSTINISNNVFEGLDEAIKLTFVDSATVTNNYMNGSNGTFGGYGAYLFRGATAMVSENYFNIGGTGIGVFNPSGEVNLINNELVATSTGIILQQGVSVNIYHNSINAGLNAISATSTTSDLDVRNNILVSNTGAAFLSSATPTASNINYNIYNSNGSFIASVGGINYATLATWKAALPSFNGNSLQGDPVFLSALDLQTVGTLANNVGDNSVGVTTDINGDARPASGATIVDIGAYEYTPKINDAALVALYQPVFGCGDSATSVQVIVKNWGLNSITSLPITVAVSGGLTNTLNFTYTGNLANRASDTVTIGTINTYALAASLTFTAYTQLVNDEDSSNDTLVKTLSFIPAMPQYVMPDSVCASATSATINAVPVNNVSHSWYASMTATNATDTGSAFTFNPSIQNTWYLGYGYDGADTISSPLTTNTGGNGGIMFYLEAKRNISVDSLILNISYGLGSQAPVSIYYIANGQIAGNETNSANWTLHDSQVIISGGVTQGTKMTLTTPLEIVAGSVYSIYVYAPVAWQSVTSTAPQIYNSQFMKITPGKGLSGLFSLPSANKQYSGSIFASEYSCSNLRVPITLPFTNDSAYASFTTTVSQPNKVDVDASASQGHIISWTFGDGGTATGIIANHTYTTGGPYTITCIVEDTVCNTIDTTTFAVNMTIGVTENELTRSINIFPNPSAGIFNLTFDVNSNEEVSIVVIDALGRTISTESFSNGSGTITRQLDLSSQARGLYFVHITAGENTVVKKITKM